MWKLAVPMGVPVLPLLSPLRPVVTIPVVVYFGANNGDRPVVILLSTLFKTGSPASIPDS